MTDTPRGRGAPLARQHTPGPWTCFYKSKYDEWHVSIPQPGGGMRWALFDDGVRSENPEADARLIAAAPDLLKACQQAIVALKGREHDGFLRDAIAKALPEAKGGER